MLVRGREVRWRTRIFDALDAAEPGLKGIDPGNHPVHAMAQINAAKRRIREIPLSGIKAEPLVNHHRLVERLARLDKEDSLAAIGVADQLFGARERLLITVSYCILSLWSLLAPSSTPELGTIGNKMFWSLVTASC